MANEGAEGNVSSESKNEIPSGSTEIKFSCVSCRRHLQIDASAGGMEVRCPDCGAAAMRSMRAGLSWRLYWPGKTRISSRRSSGESGSTLSTGQPRFPIASSGLPGRVDTIRRTFSGMTGGSHSNSCAPGTAPGATPPSQAAPGGCSAEPSRSVRPAGQ